MMWKNTVQPARQHTRWAKNRYAVYSIYLSSLPSFTIPVKKKITLYLHLALPCMAHARCMLDSLGYDHTCNTYCFPMKQMLQERASMLRVYVRFVVE